MVLAAIGAGLLIGLSLGALGGGGSILTVPALVYLLGQSAHQATATSLLVVGTAALAGAASHARAGRVRLREGAIFGVLGIAGSYAGSRASTAVPADTLLAGFGALMLAVAVLMIARRRAAPARLPGPEAAVASGLAVKTAAAGTPQPATVTALGTLPRTAQLATAQRPRPGRHLLAVMLLTAAVLDLTRCSLVLAAARHPAPTAGLVAAGLAAAGLSVRTAHGCQADRRWAGWAALLIGAASAPWAAMSGFHGPYTIPDTATAALGVLLAVAVLATAGAAGRPGQYTENPCTIDRGATW